MNQETAVGVIGAGTMGSGIAQVAATDGHRVSVFDSNADARSGAQARIHKILGRLAEKGRLDRESAKAIGERIVFVPDLQGFGDCGFVIEAVVERLDVKTAVFAEVESVVADDCVLATNTSSLSIAAISAACSKPERVIGAHFFNPAPLMPLVEIVPGLTTSEAVVHATRALIDDWGKTTVVAKDTAGFIVNRVARPFYGEALRILEEGIADVATIDWAMKEFGGFRMGPFELMDFIGNDVNYKVTETVFAAFFYDPRYKPSFAQKRLVEAGWLGRKSGRGFYDYREGAPHPQPKKDDAVGREILMRILVMLINEAADALFWQVASRDDIDLAMTKGVNYPRGLLRWADDTGLDEVLDRLGRLFAEYGEDRYRPSPLLRRMAAKGKTFYS
ncbi:MAG: 3-hydroxyacyl-CoA dehydrogenase NAD-binding domain-containing protein [Candidatus Krumholzibacteria bacterium]|nr:3-hydroxyacyl-CoA dehydrogenase NAD-binding domain-containing protein [Candidatus Krumholzibacteria bacterium]